MGHYSVTFVDQYLTVQLPAGAQESTGTYYFYLKVYISGESYYIDARDVGAGSNQYFTMNIEIIETFYPRFAYTPELEIILFKNSTNQLKPEV